MQKPNRTLLSNSGLFQGFCPLKSAKNDLKMRCQNVKLFLREPLCPNNFLDGLSVIFCKPGEVIK